jgi:hypothetical protein
MTRTEGGEASSLREPSYSGSTWGMECNCRWHLVMNNDFLWKHSSELVSSHRYRGNGIYFDQPSTLVHAGKNQSTRPAPSRIFDQISNRKTPPPLRATFFDNQHTRSLLLTKYMFIRRLAVHYSTAPRWVHCGLWRYSYIIALSALCKIFRQTCSVGYDEVLRLAARTLVYRTGSCPLVWEQLVKPHHAREIFY